MIALTKEVYKLLDDVKEEVSKNLHHIMQQLWLSWSHIGVKHDVKVTNIYKLVQIEKDLHTDVLNESKQRMKEMQQQVEELKEETKKLSQCLSVDISIAEYREDMLLFEYKNELEEQISGYRKQMRRHRMEIERLSEWQRDLTETLGATFPELRAEPLQADPLPAREELDALRGRLQRLQLERDKRAEEFLYAQIEIKGIMEKLQIKPQSEFERVVVSSLSVHFQMTDANMARLRRLLRDLQDTYDQTNNRVLELRERLSKLWECLAEDQSYRDKFLQANPGCHPETENAIKAEIKRCEDIKRHNIQVILANARTKIKLMWDNIMYSDQQREEFVHYYHNIFTEDTVDLHSMYLEKITKFYNDHKDLFKLVKTQKELWLKQAEIESRATEPGRYHNRGGNLLREEKERKRIESSLVKVRAQLREMATRYEARTGSAFTVHGAPLLQLIEQEKDSRKAERQNKLSSRKQLLSQSHPPLRSLATSPPGKRDRVAAGNNRPPAKRPRVAAAGPAHASNLPALKRPAISTLKRRVSGRVATAAVGASRGAAAERALECGAGAAKTPRASGNILKHKRPAACAGKRRSVARRSAGRAPPGRPPLEAPQRAAHTDFEDGIEEDEICRSFLVPNAEVPAGACHSPEAVLLTRDKLATPWAPHKLTKDPLD